MFCFSVFVLVEGVRSSREEEVEVFCSWLKKFWCSGAEKKSYPL